MMFMGSSSTPPGILRFAGGAGSAAARAKNLSRKLGLLLLSTALKPWPGNSMPALLSTQVPHPSAQSLRSVEACFAPRCSTHPGQAHLSPQVHPEPARDEISLIEGMVGNVGIGVVIFDVEAEDASRYIGANVGPGENDGPVLVPCLVRLCGRLLGLPGRDDLRFVGFPVLVGPADVEVPLQHTVEALAEVPLGLICDPRSSGDDRHLHFQTLLQLQGFNNESTNTDVRRVRGRYC